MKKGASLFWTKYGDTISQMQNGEEKVIAYGSKILNPAKQTIVQQSAMQ